MAYLLNYSRYPVSSKLYDPRLAYSMHLAISEDGKNFEALNHNSGVLFGLATENEDGSLNPKCLKSTCLFPLKEGGYGVVCIRTAAEGEPDEQSIGKVLFYTTKDLVLYECKGFVQVDDIHVMKVSCTLDEAKNSYVLTWMNGYGEWKQAVFADVCNIVLSGVTMCKPVQKEEIFVDIPGAVPENVIEITAQEADYLRKKLLTPSNVAMELPKEVTVSSKEELEALRAVAVYSDGTTAKKRIDWDLSGVNFEIPGIYEISGTVHQDHYEFPVAFDRADPCIGKWNGKYYFIATNDADFNHTLYIREADTIPGLVNAKEHLILDSSTYEGIGGLLWAPEFHIIEDKMYIFHAATPGPFFEEESHVLKLKEGGNMTRKEDWERPIRVVMADGSNICEMGKEITLDMTCFEWEGDYYAIWSQRQFLPKDLGAWLYIAKLNPKEPWKLLSEPVVLSKPDYSWANNHTFVDEGPFSLVVDNKLYITYSSAAVDSSYVVNYMSIEAGKDLLTPANWFKNPYPVFTSRSVDGEFGTGHNAYVEDEYGDIWNTYHARPGVDGVRSSGIRRVHFDVDGVPRLDMTEELDVNPELKKVKVMLTIK